MRKRQLYYGGARTLAYIQSRMCFGRSCSHSHMNILTVPQMNEVHINEVPGKFGHFISSSNGLILCKGHGKTYFHVVNPLTRTWVKVPSRNSWSTSCFGFACEENMHEFVPSFRIVGVGSKEDLEDNTVLIETYSSKTGKWIISSLIGTGSFNVDEFEEPYVSNCVFHWPIKDKCALAIYDPNEDENHLQLIKLPQRDVANFALTRSSNDDVLWVGIKNSLRILRFWKLPKDENGSYNCTTTIKRSEWILMHTIDTRSLCNDATLLVGNKKRKKCHGGVNSDDKVLCSLCLSVEAFTPGNPMEVILTYGLRVFRYNLESKKIELIKYRGVPLDVEFSGHMHPYVEPLCLSSYALPGDTYG